MERNRRRSEGLEVRVLASLLMVFLAAHPACADTELVPFVRVENSGLGAIRTHGFARPFDILATDMDRDGDPDLLINWHHRGRLELYENRGGKFALRNPPGTDRSGLYDNRGVPDLFAQSGVIERRIEASGKTGLFVWHDRNRAGSWRFLWKEGEEPFDGLQLRGESSLRIAAVEGLEPSEFQISNDRKFRVSLENGMEKGKENGRKQRSFSVRVPRVATQLVLQLESTPGRVAPPIFVGPQLTPIGPGMVELWKPDPHGMAWVDVAGTPEPELFVTRGALAGELRPPAAAKEDRYYLADRGGRYRRARKGIVPESYGRGRRVEWVDVDGDGELDLSISNEKVANSLLVRDPATGAFHDRAAAWGLDLVNAAVQSWGDLDVDGWPDLFYLDGSEIHVLRRAAPKADGDRSEIRFEHIGGDTIGLILPSADPSQKIIQPTSLRLSDFDNDGDLDLWVLSRGRDRSTLLFRNEGKRFTDVSKEVGIDAVQGARVVVVLDVDNDGFEDVVSFGQRTILLTNLGGSRFRADALSNHAEVGNVFAATSLDVDGDGRIDLVVSGRRPSLLRNRSDNENGFLDVALSTDGREPIGALVRAWYSNGTIRAQRYGSAHSTAYSQALRPLHFGIRKGVSIQKVGVRWPGERSEKFYDVPSNEAHLSIVR
jgi:hypothetical protein